MIINELTYQELATEANELEGGLDLSLNFTQFKQQTSLLETASTSGPAGSTSVAKGGSLKIDTSGFGGIVLGI
ncbi:MAG: CTB family bacteriocin [Leptolyngbya sp. Prado105]|jgi:hypothetical protein|nr:CTB family bacteriocin [Leptolyngbya sp. Prado105]